MDGGENVSCIPDKPTGELGFRPDPGSQQPSPPTPGPEDSCGSPLLKAQNVLPGQAADPEEARGPLRTMLRPFFQAFYRGATPSPTGKGCGSISDTFSHVILTNTVR